MNPMIKGYAKSVTMWAAGILGVLSEVAPYATPDALTALGLDGTTVKRVGAFFVFVMIVCRHLTTKSLTEKGSCPVLPPPQETTVPLVNPQPEKLK